MRWGSPRAPSVRASTLHAPPTLGGGDVRGRGCPHPCRLNDGRGGWGRELPSPRLRHPCMMLEAVRGRPHPGFATPLPLAGRGELGGVCEARAAPALPKLARWERGKWPTVGAARLVCPDARARGVHRARQNGPASGSSGSENGSGTSLSHWSVGLASPG